MSAGPSFDEIAYMRHKLLKLEHVPRDCDPIAVAQFKSAALNTLADAEAELAIIENLAQARAASTVSRQSIAEIEALEDGYASVPLNKLD
jgi:hypothetical protein